MVSVDRQAIMEANRSLRNIKNELENLLEKGIIDEGVYDTIHSALPEESPLSGPLRTASSNNTTPASVTPARSSVASPATTMSTNPPAEPPTHAFANLDVKSKSPAPPSYDETPAPSVPARSNKPVIAHARGLYAYNATDGRDLAFERDDKIMVHEYMNQDWWMGMNVRTGKEGIFPRNYVLVEHEEKAPAPQYGYPPPVTNGPPAQQNPYNSHVPPMAIAEGSGGNGQPQDPSKTQQYGKKFGKKLGNAAIFGAGATIGGNIVNSIF